MISKIKKSSAKLVSSEISKLENSETKRRVHSSSIVHRGWTGVTSRDATPLAPSLSLGSLSVEWRVEVLTVVLLCSHMANQVDVVIKVSYKILTDVLSSAAGISNKLSF